MEIHGDVDNDIGVQRATHGAALGSGPQQGFLLLGVFLFGKVEHNVDLSDAARVGIVFNFPAKEYTEKQKALLWAAAESCPVGRSLHPDVIVNITMNFQG